MNESPSTMNREPTNQTPSPDHFSKIAFWKVGIIEILLVGIVLALLFGILNYFSILPLSNLFPKHLSFLPRQTVKQNYTPVVVTPAPQGAVEYDIKKAEFLLTQYIREEINPELLPMKLDIIQGQSIDGRLEKIKYQFGVRFSTDDAAISSTFHFKENTNEQSDFTIFAEPVSVSNTSVTVSLANSLLKRYFVNPYLVKNCQEKTATSYCENFQTLKEGKKGYGVVFIRDVKSIFIVFNCFRSKEYKDYDTVKSCISPW